jgi:hypothetical protein
MWRLVVMVAPLSLIFFAAQAMVLAGTRLAYPGESADPFAPYEAIMPGQLVALSNYPCDPSTTDLYLQNVLCEIHPDSGPFVSVSSHIFNRRFVQTSFSSHDLSIGDVVSRWGRPDAITTTDGFFYVLWNNRGLIGIIDPIGPIGRFHYVLPIEYFTIGLQQFNDPTMYPK